MLAFTKNILAVCMSHYHHHTSFLASVRDGATLLFVSWKWDRRRMPLDGVVLCASSRLLSGTHQWVVGMVQAFWCDHKHDISSTTLSEWVTELREWVSGCVIRHEDAWWLCTPFSFPLCEGSCVRSGMAICYSSRFGSLKTRHAVMLAVKCLLSLSLLRPSI